MTRDQLIAMAKTAAEAHGIDPALLCALVHHESGWNTWAVRFEPAFYERYVQSMKGLSPTEMHGGSTKTCRKSANGGGPPGIL